ncbi:MAG: hypothetical protein ACI89J_001139 [Hyphomicrobiaceae bacterium]
MIDQGSFADLRILALQSAQLYRSEVMISRSWIERSANIEPPIVGAVNFQVRTGISAPFEPHMTGQDERPVVAPVNFQVRTGISAPFEPHMTGDDAVKPETQKTVNIPTADFMTDD